MEHQLCKNIHKRLLIYSENPNRLDQYKSERYWCMYAYTCAYTVCI